MKPTERDLAVARAVLDACTNASNEPWMRHVRALDLAAVIAAIPEPEPLPAPTGPGWWWARTTRGPHWIDRFGKPMAVRWIAVEVIDVRGSFSVWIGDRPCPMETIDAWFPLTPPGGEA